MPYRVTGSPRQFKNIGASLGLTSETTKLLDGGGPERATALFAGLAQDADGSRVPIDVADPE